jgi:hypothetical protein
MFDTVRKGMNITEEEELITELSKKQKAALVATGATLAIKALKGRGKKKKKKEEDEPDVSDEPKSNPATDGVIEGSRFNRLLRFGLSPEGTADIPITKRAFKDMKKAGPNLILRDKIFKVTDKTFDYLLNDDILYNRFIILLHRKETFGEETMKSLDDEFAIELNETAGTSVLPDAHEHPFKVNYVGKFSNSTMAKAFINDMTSARLGSVTWVSPEGNEIQFLVHKSSVGQEAGTTQVGNQQRPVATSQITASSDVQLVHLVAKYGGKLSKFEGDIREGLDYGPSDELAEGLQKKAEKSNIPYDIIAEVYARGLYDWEQTKKTGNSTPNQWAFARVNSFASGGRTITEDDSDLWEEYLERIPLSGLDSSFEENELIEEVNKDFEKEMTL